MLIFAHHSTFIYFMVYTESVGHICCCWSWLRETGIESSWFDSFCCCCCCCCLQQHVQACVKVSQVEDRASSRKHLNIWSISIVIVASRLKKIRLIPPEQVYNCSLITIWFCPRYAALRCSHPSFQARKHAQPLTKASHSSTMLLQVALRKN